MKVIKWWSALCLVFVFSHFHASQIFGATEIDGDITASTLTVTGPVSMSSVTVNTLTLSSGTLPSFTVTGTILADDAPVGRIGEFVSATASNVAGGATNTYANIASISLTAGDWDVTGIVYSLLNGAGTYTETGMAVSLSSGNVTTDQVAAYNSITGIAPTAVANQSLTVPRFRVSTASTVPVYLKSFATYGSGSPKFYGSITARRTR